MRLNTEIAARQPSRDAIAKAVAEFEANGGKIIKLEQWETSAHQVAWNFGMPRERLQKSISNATAGVARNQKKKAANHA